MTVFFVVLLVSCAFAQTPCSDHQTCSACEADPACDFCADSFGRSVCAESAACPALMMQPDHQCCVEQQSGSCSGTFGCVRCAASNVCVPSLACTSCDVYGESSCDAAALCLWCNDRCQHLSDVCVRSDVSRVPFAIVIPVVFSLVGVLLCLCVCLLNKRRNQQPAIVYVQPTQSTTYPGNFARPPTQITTTEYMAVAVMPVRVTVSERTPLVLDSSI